MDLAYIDSDEEAESMATAMGFSSFGTQGLAKKRKYNSSVDAVVEGQDLTTIDRGGKKGQGSGGNQIPLGKSRVLGISNTSNMDDRYENDEQPAQVNTNLAPSTATNTEEEFNGPAYIDTSLPPPFEEMSAGQANVDAILARPNVKPLRPAAEAMDQSRTPGIGQGISQYLPALQNVSHLQHSRPVTLIGDKSPNVRSNRQVQHGQRNTFWYMDYYDQSFNENPWARLEKERSLQPTGECLETAGRAA